MQQSQTVYLPRDGDKPPEPAPYVMTAEDVVRLLQSSSTNPYHALYRLRQRGLKCVAPMGKVRFLLPDVLAMLEDLKESDPR
jgi:hypothetical protein